MGIDLVNKDSQSESDDDEYEILNIISRGSFGVVYRVRSKKSNEIVAMKEEVDGLSPTTLMEINILQTLPPHPCIVGFKQVATDDGKRVLVVMEHMKSDLRRWREAGRRPYALNEIKYLMEEILKGVAFLHDNGVMHRDLKPSNILIGDKAEIKICDFGWSARFGGPAPSKHSPEAGTLWYKAPELLLGTCDYSCEVDMWSVGCIMAEFLLDRVLFQGTSECDQLYCIHRVFKPPFSLLRMRIAAAVEEFPNTAAAALTPAGFDLLKRLLAYETRYRITARDALDHAWFSED